LDIGPNLGFVTVIQENSGYLGGYLITNHWGRPLEFRLTTAVQPTRVQQILYGETLKPHIFADLIGKTLVERSNVGVQLLLTDCRPLLDLRHHLAVPVLWLADPADDADGLDAVPQGESGLLVCHPKFQDDHQAARTVLERVPADADLSEPFSRIREALAEARKLGVTARSA
jgi:hypothetical protein